MKSHIHILQTKWRWWVMIGILLVIGLWIGALANTISLVTNFYKDPGQLLRQDPDSKIYSQAGEAWMQRYEAAITQFSLLQTSPHWQDPQWQQDVHRQLDAIRAVDADIESYDPPFLYQTWHGGLRNDVVKYYEQFATMYSDGVDHQDQVKITLGLDALATAETKRKRFQLNLQLIK